jgi:hypothetical protein
MRLFEGQNFRPMTAYLMSVLNGAVVRIEIAQYVTPFNYRARALSNGGQINGAFFRHFEGQNFRPTTSY